MDLSAAPRRRRLLAALLPVLLLGGACAARAVAGELDLSLDLRLVTTSDLPSFVQGGPGRLRFDGEHQGLRLGRARLAWTGLIGEQWRVHVDASDWGDHDRNGLDLTEAYLDYRPYPRAGLRLRLRAGAFYPPLSLENRGTGWDNPYTISSSAIDSWIAEEIRIVGLEGGLSWLGTQSGHDSDLGLLGGAFRWNDPAGTALADHGFTLTDRQSTLFGRAGEPLAPGAPGRTVFREIDGRTGYYAGAEWKYLDRGQLRALHYDNRADPTRYDATLGDFAWETRFDAVSARLESGTGWTVIAEWLDGLTRVAPQGESYDWNFDSASLLLSRRLGAQRATLRFDEFRIRMGPNTTDAGHAWTLGWTLEPDPRWRLALEWIDVTARTGNERQLQLSVRYALALQLGRGR